MKKLLILVLTLILLIPAARADSLNVLYDLGQDAMTVYGTYYWLEYDNSYDYECWYSDIGGIYFDVDPSTQKVVRATLSGSPSLFHIEYVSLNMTEQEVLNAWRASPVFSNVSAGSYSNGTRYITADAYTFVRMHLWVNFTNGCSTTVVAELDGYED